MAQHIARNSSVSDIDFEAQDFLAPFCIALSARIGAALAARRLGDIGAQLRVTDPVGAMRTLTLGAGSPCCNRARYLLIVGVLVKAVESLLRSGGVSPALGTKIDIDIATQFAKDIKHMGPSLTCGPEGTLTTALLRR